MIGPDAATPIATMPLVGTTVYALFDPRTNEIRYVGKTVRPLRTRYWGHIKESRYFPSTHKARWLEALRRDGVRPAIMALAVVPDDMGSEMECRVIAHFRARGYRLTNLTDGGDGVAGYAPTPEECAAISARQKANVANSERLRNLNRARAGHQLSADARAKLSRDRKGKPKSAEHRQNISLAIRRARAEEGVRPHSAETREKMSKARKGRPLSPERRAANAAHLRAINAARIGKPGRKHTAEGSL